MVFAPGSALRANIIDAWTKNRRRAVRNSLRQIRVQAVRGDAGARQTARKLPGEQDVAQLGATIGGQRSITFDVLQIIEIEHLAQMRC
jgi:hypothetical protein